MSIRVSVDASGGDHGISVTIPAGIAALKEISDLEIVFVGNKANIQSEIDKSSLNNKFLNRVYIQHASEIVAMDELPSHALRRKKDSSMRVAINLVKEGKVSACVSAGNTGALMAISRFVLKTIQGVDRPAIMARIPTYSGHTHVLDLGANVDSSPAALLEFAIMGSEAVKHTENVKRPTVGLLNVGEEEIKGNEKIKNTASLIKNTNLNYYGYVEGDDIYKGVVDVVVCDGFEGNIALKASEGVVGLMSFFLKKAFSKNLLTKLGAFIVLPILRKVKSDLDPGKYNGATLLGLKGIVVKSHGGAGVNSFKNAIHEAYRESKVHITDKISEQITKEVLQNNE